MRYGSRECGVAPREAERPAKVRGCDPPPPRLSGLPAATARSQVDQVHRAMGAPTPRCVCVTGPWSSHPRASRGTAARPDDRSVGRGPWGWALYKPASSLVQLHELEEGKRRGRGEEAVARWGRPWRGARAQPWRDGRMGCEAVSDVWERYKRKTILETNDCSSPQNNIVR